MTLSDLLPVPQALAVRAAALAGACAIVAGALGAIWLSGRAHGVAAERPKVEAAQAVARTAVAQGALESVSARSAAGVADRTVQVVVQSEEAARAVQTAHGADAPLDPAVLSRWRAGVERLRGGEISPAAADDSGGAEPARTLPSPVS
ncbi:hypothetical protein BH09PSE2_BH09PSE2_15070 [soil metagenome]